MKPMMARRTGPDRARSAQVLLRGMASTLLALLSIERVASAATGEGSIMVQVDAGEVGMCAGEEFYEDTEYLIDEIANGWATPEGAISEFLVDRTTPSTNSALKAARPTLTIAALDELHEITAPSRELEFVRRDEHLGGSGGESYEAWDSEGKTRVGLVILDEQKGRYNIARSVICNSALYTDADRFMEILNYG